MPKTWLITGSSRGFGRELAGAVLRRGDNAVATAWRPERLEDLLRSFGERVRAVALDVTVPDAARAAVQVAQRECGSLDVVVNNAGYANSAPIEEMSEEDFLAQFEADLFGVLNATKAALPVLRERRGGHFLQFSSMGGRVGDTPGMGAYQTAKFAVEGFSEVLAAEVKPFGDRVTIIGPGAFRTDWGGASQRRVPVGPDYEQTVGEMNRYREATVHNWPGDPARGRAAEILADVVASDDPPLRLLLGAGTVESAERSATARAEEARRWAAVGRSADFPPGE